MKCNYCEFESDKDFSFCPNCGANHKTEGAVESQTITPVESGDNFAGAVLSLVKDKLFLALCIIVTALCGIGFLFSWPSLFAILFAIFLWIIYSAGQKNTIDHNKFRSLSGTMYAVYVVNLISSFLIFGLGILLFIGFSSIETYKDFIAEVVDELEQGYFISENIFDTILTYYNVIAIVLLLTCIVSSIVLFLFDIFGYKSIHKFLKSLYKSIETGSAKLEKAKTASAWLTAFGVFEAISVLAHVGSFDFISVLTTGATAAAYFISAKLIKKYFM